MPVQPTYPGVYVQEVPSGVRTIAGVSTSVTLFIGRTKWGPVNEPILCLNYTDFDRTFTSDTSQGDMARAVRLFFLNGGTQCYVMRVAQDADAAPANNFATASVTLQDTAPADTLVVSARYPGDIGNSIRVEVTHHPTDTELFNLKLYRLVTNSFGVAVETDAQTFSGLSMNTTHPRYAINYVDYKWAVLSHPPVVSTLRPDVTPPGPPTVPAVLVGGQDGIAPSTSHYDDAYELIDREVDIFNLMVLPRDADTTGLPQSNLWGNASVFCERRRAFLLMDPQAAWTNAQTAIDNTTGVSSLRTGLVNDHSAIFFPNVTVRENGQNVHVGPSGAMAGLMARIDANRGVWKAPAGTEAGIRGISGLQYRFSDGDSGVLNPQGVNVLRIFPNGIVNWGGRTMDGDDDFASEWKYIPVRRTALFIEESLYRGLKWVVFEPNDEPLWAQIRLNVGAFMHNLFRQGAFQGTTKKDAYFVKCDRETTTQNDIDRGIVNIWVGFAPLKPAEFVILYLQQMAGQIQV